MAKLPTQQLPPAANLAAQLQTARKETAEAMKEAAPKRVARRPEDEEQLLAQGVVTDEQGVQDPWKEQEGVQVAQRSLPSLPSSDAPAAVPVDAAAPAASASAGAGVAAEGSASAGAGAPLAALGGGGLGIGALAAGGLGVAALAGGGGGGGGGGSSTPAAGGGESAAASTAPTTATTSTTTTTTTNTTGHTQVLFAPGTKSTDPAVDVTDFASYRAALAQPGGDTTPIALNAGTNPKVEITHGFNRENLAFSPSLAELRTILNNTNNFGQALDDRGITYNIAQGQSGALQVVNAANQVSSTVIWQQELTVTGGSTTQSGDVLGLFATSTGAPADAEIGVVNASATFSGAGLMDAGSRFVSSATDGSAIITVSNASVRADGSQGYAHQWLEAKATDTGIARVTIENDVNLRSDSDDANTRVVIKANGDATSTTEVDINGSVNLDSNGTTFASARAVLHGQGSGVIDIDGSLSASVSAASANIWMQAVAEGQSAVRVGSMSMDVSSERGWMDIWTDHANGLEIGSVSVNMASGGVASVNVGTANSNNTTGMIDSPFISHGASSTAVNIATANINGDGVATLNLNVQTFGVINQAADVNQLDLRYTMADSDGAAGSAPLTVLNGFEAADTSIVYNGVAANATNFGSAGSHATAAALHAAIETALNGTVDYAFAVYTGAGDINGDGINDTNSGVLAWDADGTGVTSMILLQNVNTLSHTDLG